MRFRLRTWLVISLICLLSVLVFWRLAEQRASQERTAATAANQVAADTTNQTTVGSPAAVVAPTNVLAGKPEDPFRYRLTNTVKSVDALVRADQSIILQNALIDSSAPINLTIPAQLRAEGDPGSYVVQARGPLTDAFREQLRQAGAEVVSYIPNNAYLVRASAEAVRGLAALAGTQAVVPWEPYFKLEPRLLALAVEQKSLPSHAQLNLLLFPGERERVLQVLAGMDVTVLGEDRSPFGPLLTVRPAEDGLVSLARLTGVQVIEFHYRRALANDLARERVRVATNTTTATSFLGLTGKGVRVNVNDTGVEANHVDLKDRVTGDSAYTLEDFDGHGTHVAGTIASSGANGPKIGPGRVPGSITNANFRGMAPEAEIYALPLDATFGPSTPDTYLQENPAKTNALISNNSWGYLGSASYSLASASWDSAVRDALPGQQGSQSLITVFAAGNRGGAGIDAPATAKNVITVGAIENIRYITNEVIRGTPPNQTTNRPWLGMTDTNNQIADFSSLGNVGPGAEGRSGRFKPDLVAPGTFTASTRSSHWVQPTNNVTVFPDEIPAVRIRAGRTNNYSAFVPRDGVGLEVVCVSNALSPASGLPPLPIQIRAGSPPTSADFVNTNRAFVSTLSSVPDTWHFSVANTNADDVYLNIRYFVSITNDLGNEPEVMFNLQSLLAPNYRFESGTSMAAPVVSGLLALMQQFFQDRFQLTNSPALMKALLINGARSVSSSYDYNVTNIVTGQGWGLPNLTNSLPNGGAKADKGIFNSPTMVFYDQHPERALATGQSHERTIDVTATAQPMRITLVWTDPPGNPAVGIKLVNDLDLIVKDEDTGQVYVGNSIGAGSLFNDSIAQVDTNSLPLDRINNVENVYLFGSFNSRLSSRYTVSVVGRRVNVNAVTAHTNGVVQDYALVITSGNPRGGATPAIVVSTPETLTWNGAPSVQTVTNGIPLLNQRVGANTPFLVTTNGVTNQWRFYVVTNTLPESDPAFGTGVASNIAFATFFPPNISRSRFSEADIDLYVSDNRDLTNLVESVISGARKSTRRTGTESIVIKGAPEGQIYYAGVKSEDQQSANFGFFAVSSSSSFSQTDTNGDITMQGYPRNAPIPDGSPDSPQAGFMFAFCTEPIVLQNVVVTNLLTHEYGGDLFGVLEHDLQKSILNANRTFSNTVEYVYDDSDSGNIPVSTPTDAPGTLRNFVGEEGVGVWQLTMVDSAPGFVGTLNEMEIHLERRKDELTNGVGVAVTIQPGRWFYTVVDVPADATNLTVCVGPEEGPLEVYIARGFFPDRIDYDIFAIIQPPGDCVSLTRRDSPPLSQGRYFIGVFNPNAIAVNARIRVRIDRDLTARTTVAFRSDRAADIFDDATTNSIIHVGRRGTIADLQVGVRIEHPRVSDLVLHLTSPLGTRLMLAENRGGPFGANYGFGSLQELIAPSSSQGGPQASTNVIGPVQTEGTIEFQYDFFGVPDRVTIYYDGVPIFDSGLINGSGTISVDYGPGAATNIVVVMNEGNNPNIGTAWQYTARIVSGYVFATFTDNTNFARVPIKFATPPFTNFNYSVTTRVTNGVVLNDGFDAFTPAGSRVFAGQRFSGWEVSSGEIEVAPLFGMPFPYTPVTPHSGGLCIDIAGFGPGAIFTNLVTVPGQDYLASFVYQRNSGNPQTVSAALSIDGATRLSVVAPVNVATNWVPTNFTFRANGVSTRLGVASTTFNGDLASAVFFDTFKVVQIVEKVEQGIYFQPEEPLTPLRGQNAFGDWKLEVWDNRVGAVLTNVLLAWKLNVTFVNTNPPTVTLTNGVSYCSVLGSNQTAYFIVDVPASASTATNAVSASQDVSLIYSAVGIPIGVEPPDTFFFRDDPAGTAILGGGGWNSRAPGGALQGGSTVPQLRPGFRYYLAVHNEFPGTNAFCITVSFDRTGPNIIPIIPIPNGGTNNCSTRFTSATNRIDYFSFDVSTSGLGAEFTVSNISSGDINIYVRRGLPLPGPALFDALGTNTGTLPEFVHVGDLTGTRMAGRWYIAIESSGPGISYQLCAREIPGTVIPIPVNTDVPGFAQTNAAGYYRVVISPNAYQANFRVKNIIAGGDVDLYISTDTMLMLHTAPTNAMFASTNPGNADELIPLTVYNATQFLTPGTWYLAVVSRTGAPVSYTVRVDEFTTNLDYITLTNGVPYSNSVATAGAAGYYRFDVAPNALQVVFETLGSSGDVDLYIRWGFPLPPPGPNVQVGIHHSSTNTFPAEEWLPLTADRPAAFPFAGTWWIAVVPKAPAAAPINYRVRATQILRSEVTRLQNGATSCSVTPRVDPNALHSGAQFYRFDVGPNPIRGLFEAINLSGDVDLYLQYGLPITNYTLVTRFAPQTHFYRSENLGLNPESICVLTNQAPVPLTSGTWYLTVVNRTARDVTNCVRASVLLSNDIPRLGDGIPQCGVVDSGGAGQARSVDYYLFSVDPDAVQVTFETLFASGNVDLYVKKAAPATNCATLALDPATFRYFSTNSGQTLESICLKAPAPGDWYVAVVNREPNAPVTYCVRATQITTANLTQVEDGKAGCKQVGVGNGAMNTGINYWGPISFPTPPALATFETYGNGNVDMYLVRDDGCLPNFATFNSALTNYPYASENPGTVQECIMMDPGTLPIPLGTGEQWYVAVVNRSIAPVDYCFLYTTWTNNPAVPLTNNIATCGLIVPPTSNTGGIGVNYYIFTVSSNALAATFKTYDASGNVDIYLQQGFCFPHRDTFDLAEVIGAYSSTNPGTNDEFICVDRGATPLPLTPGDWYVAVVNRETNDVTFCLMATEMTSDSTMLLTNAMPFSPTFGIAPLGVDYYRYRPSTNAVQVNFEILGPDGDVNLYLDPGLCQNNPQNFSYASTNAGPADELIIVATNSFPVPLTGGDWLVAVASVDPGQVYYTIRVTEVYPSDIIQLTNAVPYTSTVDPQGSVASFPVDYYVFNVSTNAVRAQFEIRSPSGNVNLVARKGLPLPALINADYLSTNGGLSAELIVVRDTSLPVPLSPGDWYLAVLNTTATPVTYTVQATEHSSAGTNISVGSATMTSNQLCLTWVNLLPEVNYYVQGKASLSDPAWVPVSATLRAASNQITWCLPLPSPYHFFRLTEGLSPWSAGSPVTVSSMTFTPGNLTFQWTASPNLRFTIEWSDSLSGPWKPYPDYITSATTTYTFTDNGTKTAPLGAGRYYRIFPVP